MKELRGFLWACELIAVWKEIVEAEVGSQGENGFLFHQQGTGMGKERCSVRGAAGSHSYGASLSPSVEEWRRGVGEVSVVWDWGPTWEIWWPLSYIKGLDTMVLGIDFSL